MTNVSKQTETTKTDLIEQPRNFSWAVYRIDQRIEEAVANAVNPETGEINEIKSQELEKLYTEREELITDVVHFYKNALVYAETIGDEIKKLQDRKKQMTNIADRVKQLLSGIIPNGEKVKSGTFEIGWRKSTEVIDWQLDIEDLEKKFPALVRVKITKELDKVATKKLYSESGLLPTGIEIVEKNNIQIK